MELYRVRRSPDYSELAYRESVAKLKYLLAESYTPVTYRPTEIQKTVDKEVEERTSYPLVDTGRLRVTSPYIFSQEQYIEQLEKEGQLYREELSRVLERMKDVVEKPQAIDEEEYEREVKSSRPRNRTGPSIVYSSRISELEAQLTQSRLELRKVQDEASYLKAHSKPIQAPISQQSVAQMDALHRERDELNERVISLQALVSQLRDKEASATQKAKRSLDVVDQAQFDKNQLEMDVRRLKCELERMSEKQREALQESARRVSEAERRYAMQIERLNGDLAAQWDAANRLNLELDRARRSETDLRRDLAQKTASIEELKKELNSKTGSLQKEALTAGAERESLESELAACKLSVERAERQGRHETSGLQAEVQALRGRLDRADQDTLHSRKENIRLNDIIATLEKELNLAKLTKDSATSNGSKRTEELTSMMKEIEAKHEESVSGLIQSQTQLLEKLNLECQALNQRLEESSNRHKEEMGKLQNNIDYLSSKLDTPDHYRNETEWRDDGKLGEYKIDENSTSESGIQNNNKGEQGRNYPSNPTVQGVEKEDYGSGTQINGPLIPGREDSYQDGQDVQQPSKQSDPAVEEYAQGKVYNQLPEGSYEQDKEPEKDLEFRQTGSEYNQNSAYDQPEAIYDQGYDQSGAEYNKDQDYNESQPYVPTGLEYDQTQGYDQTSTDYNPGQVYDQAGVTYDQDQSGVTYDQNQEGVTYDQDQAGLTYDQGQAYEQAPTEYKQDQEYDQSAAEYAQRQVYDQSGGNYEEGHTYDPTAASHKQSTPGYDETTTAYNEGQAYDQTEYDQGAYDQTAGYPEGQVYDGTGEIYQPEESFVSTPTTQNYEQKDHSYQEKK